MQLLDYLVLGEHHHGVATVLNEMLDAHDSAAHLLEDRPLPLNGTAGIGIHGRMGEVQGDNETPRESSTLVNRRSIGKEMPRIGSDDRRTMLQWTGTLNAQGVEQSMNLFPSISSQCRSMSSMNSTSQGIVPWLQRCVNKYC